MAIKINGGNLLVAFIKFVLQYLSEQGISHQQVVTDFSGAHGLSFGEHRDLVDQLRAHGLEVEHAAVKPDAVVAPSAAEVKAAEAAAAESGNEAGSPPAAEVQTPKPPTA